jgi:hypothetical protein
MGSALETDNILGCAKATIATRIQRRSAKHGQIVSEKVGPKEEDARETLSCDSMHRKFMPQPLGRRHSSTESRRSPSS